MKLLNPNQKPETCVSKDETRPHITNCHLDVERRVIVSTDGHRMTILPVLIDPQDTTGPIPVKAIADARKQDGEIKANGAATLANGATWARPDVASFPPYEQLIPEREEIQVSFNARYLWELAQALGADRHEETNKKIEPLVTLSFNRFNPGYEPIIVTSGNKSRSEGKAVLMPVRL